MLKIVNDAKDRDFIVTARHIPTGNDGVPATVGPGQSATIEVDGDHQVFISTRPREAGEAPITLVPTAAVEGEAQRAPESGAGETELPDADDDTVRGEIQAMVDSKENLTSLGQPKLEALNQRLKDKGFGPVKGQRRDALMPQPA